MAHGKLTSPYMTVIQCHANLLMYKKWLESQYGFFVSDHTLSELYRLAAETVRSSISYRDFIVNINKHLSKTTLWARESMVDPLLADMKKKIVHWTELGEIKSEVASGKDNPYKEHWGNFILGALSGYGKIDVAADSHRSPGSLCHKESQD